MQERESQRQKTLTRRAALLAGGQVLLITALAGRMYQLQILDKDRYTLLADENRINLRLLAPRRGRIVDRFGIKLADNRQDYRAVIVAEQAGDIPATLAAVGKLLGIDAAEHRRVMRDIRRKHSFVPVVIKSDLNWDEMARVEVATPELPGVSIEQGLTRFYPYGALAAHVVGYVAAPSEADLTGDPLLELPDFRIGKSGIEKSQDEVLRGSAGTSQVEVNAYGRVVRELARIEGKPGQDAVLGLDMAMQDFITRRCADQTSVSCVLLDVASGEVLAMVSSPSFDPMLFTNGLTQANWQELSTDPRHPLVNKATAGVYPPGSTFKPVVAMAALDSGAITPETVINCPGYLKLGDATFHCWRAGGHGPLRVRDAIKHSCDVFFYETAHRTGIHRVGAMARRFGFGNPLGIDIPGERGGLVPSPAWQLATTGSPWEKGETLIVGIGQGAMLATPLQIATMVARLTTGRAIVPHFVRTAGVMTASGTPAGDYDGLGVDPQHLALVLDGMNAVVNEQGGTAFGERIKEPGFAMGGKSGTSQVRRITAYERAHGLVKEKDLPWKDRDHALFVAFAPVGAPRYACVTVIEHGGGGSVVSAPIVRDVLLEVQRRDPARQLPAGTIAQDVTVLPQFAAAPTGSAVASAPVHTHRL